MRSLPATFLFLAQYVIKLEKKYWANPSLFYLDLSPLNVGIKPVWYGSPGNHSKTPHLSSSTSPQGPRHPCAFCTSKGFKSNHFALNYRWGVAKLSSPYILQIISDTKACPSCANVHEPSFQCKLGASKVCPMGCEHNGIPLNQHVCEHSNHTPSFTVSKLESNRSIPLVESVDTGSSSIGIQYDLGSQLSLISRSTLQKLPPDMYTVVKTYHINLLPFTGDGSKVLATEVVLKLNRFKLQLYAIEDELNNTLAFSIVMPNQRRACTRHSQLSYSGKISVLLGGDNCHAFPKEQDRNSTGTTLFKIEITNKYLIFGHPNSKIFKWKEPVRIIIIDKFKTRTPSTNANPAYHTTPPPTPTGL